MKKRAETGAMQFGEDWPGVFIRGDNASYYAFLLSQVLEKSDLVKNNNITFAYLDELVKVLRGCTIVEGKEPKEVQYMKEFNVAAIPGDDKED